MALKTVTRARQALFDDKEHEACKAELKAALLRIKELEQKLLDVRLADRSNIEQRVDHITRIKYLVATTECSFCHRRRGDKCLSKKGAVRNPHQERWDTAARRDHLEAAIRINLGPE